MNFQYAQKKPIILVGVGFLAVFTLMIMVIWLSMSTLHAVTDSMSDLVESTSQKTTQAYRMRDVIRQRSTTVSTLIRPQEPHRRQAIFNKLIDFSDDYQMARAQIQALESNNQEQSILEQIDNASTRVDSAIASIKQHLQQGIQYNVVLHNSVLRGKFIELELQELVLLNLLNDLVTLETRIAKHALHENQQTYHETQKLLVAMVIACFALSLAIATLVVSRVTKATRRISHLASHDDLTGLHNRRSFEQHLQHTINVAQSSPSAHGLLYIDLDRFKMVNDTCGHQAGDQLLLELTKLISSRLRPGDIFARLGGDEFAIIAQGSSFDDIQTSAEELRHLVCDFIFYYETQSFKVSLSMGLTHIDGQLQSVEQTLADADAACYIAKQSGRNRVHVKQDNDAEIVQYRSNLAGVQSIRQALTDERLSLYCQPIYKVGSDLSETAHCEILLRIQSESGELYSPRSTISIAENTGIMTEIDRWVFDQVIDWIVTTQTMHIIPRLLINISGHSFADDEFSELVINRLQQGDVDPACIAFEISEASIEMNFEQLKKFTDRIRPLGCKLALNDFGSGYTNFTHLKNLWFDYLKIDGSLVSKITTNAVDRNMVSAINQMSQTVGAKTIAEFVEDAETLHELKNLEVDFAQGYGLKRPTPLNELIDDLPTRVSSRADSAKRRNETTNDSESNPPMTDVTSIDLYKRAS